MVAISRSHLAGVCVTVASWPRLQWVGSSSPFVLDREPAVGDLTPADEGERVESVRTRLRWALRCVALRQRDSLPRVQW